jgi:hypothetical protein
MKKQRTYMQIAVFSETAYDVSFKLKFMRYTKMLCNCAGD